MRRTSLVFPLQDSQLLTKWNHLFWASLFAAQCAARCYWLIKSEITYFQKGLLGLYLGKKTPKKPYIKEYLRTC